MHDNPRIEELRRRVQKDPASIAFAQLAEEYRRAGGHQEAIQTCRAGLSHHPGYLSARVTLGRALIEVGDFDAARNELKTVLQSAPENLAAIRGMADVHHKRGELREALAFYRAALSLAQHDPDLEQTVEEISRKLEPAAAPVPASGGLSFEEASAELMSTFGAVPDAPVSAKPPSAAPPEPKPGPKGDPSLPELERFLDAIHSYRHRRAV